MSESSATPTPAGASVDSGNTGVGGRVPSADTTPEGPISAQPVTGNKTKVRPGDRIFRGLTTGSGVLVVVLIGLIGLFLLVQAIPSIGLDQVNFLTSREWSTNDPANLRFGILDLLLVTVATSVVALVIAMPVSLGIALFLTQYAPPKLARPFAYAVDLLAAVPSIIFGLWGLYVLAPQLAPIASWLNDTLGFIPIFADGNVSSEIGGTIFTAGVVLGIMLLPIITSLTREVFQRTPVAQIEGALALGATRWEVIRTTVLPFGKAGYISASMLGLGRALGETIALTIILLAPSTTFGGSIFDGGATFASKIASASSEFNDPRSVGAYITAGLVLFLLTFLVNFAGRAIVSGKKEYR
ncbi:phosphate ABC transporter permease subunit PstC [Goodfellowiella coeruleoviolacea]|uniref:Phosphate transport system permease protein n=1 Tax=Goodfellowiella coeruleoviolacea TaxID=334858 RepID=A0AAE3GD65_9PSEU|nr:phosphate ABC transporter permease subunit PstC [Goodfellowiella coeruleoviolacea]MCP2166097.1 phosphate ABC transporter membrane protein 1, PhoT family (TC 3.A.1.7.1) [Goodfellowiella coeruleoviolacea]